jgi:hypothetical protein
MKRISKITAAHWREFNKFVGVEHRQFKLAANAEAIERWQRKLFRAATELKKLTEQRKRLLKGPSKKGYTEMPLTGIGGGAVDGLDDSLEGL